MAGRLKRKLRIILESYLPEQRLYLRSGDTTRFIRLRSHTQALAFAFGSVVVAWTAVATAIVFIGLISSNSSRDQILRERSLFESRLNEMAQERDVRARAAYQSQARFYVALEQVSAQQTRLLASEERRREMETGLSVVQRSLRRTMKERDAALRQSDTLRAELRNATSSTRTASGRSDDLATTLDFMTTALADTAGTRDGMGQSIEELNAEIDTLKHNASLTEERTDRIFRRLEEAVTVSLEPLDRMFENAGIPTDKIIEDVRSGYSGQGGPLMPIAMSTMGDAPDPNTMRFNELISELDRINIYRIAIDRSPFAFPLNSSYRFTSPYGQRNGRMHDGVDLAAPTGTPVLATADGVVTFSGWSSGYGKLVKIRHALGFETRYAHLSKFRVRVGQRVSRGDRIGDMGSTGHSTGPHVHYEVRLNGRSRNPMKYIKAGRNVF